MNSDSQIANEHTSDWSESPAKSDKPAPRDLTGLVLGDFRVQRLIGRGGMGEVYLAEQISLRRPVALKVLLPEWTSRPAYLSRFSVEATAVAKLNHPNIVQVYALGEADGIHYIAMEYVEGTNLREYLIRKGSLEIPLALSIMRQSASAIGAAGEVGLIHRDVKPENLLLTRKGRIKVADFGLCRDSESDRLHVTQQGTTMGTPLYMSPEQAQGHSLDPRSDLYSLGVTYYHMLVGEPPFRAENALALAMKHVREPVPSMRIRRPDIPVELDRLVLKLMAKRPADRYQSAAEMLADLAKIRSQMTTVAGAAAADFTIPPPSMEADADEPAVPSGAASRSSSAVSSRGVDVGGLMRALSAGGEAWFRPGVLAALSVAGLTLGGLLGWRSVADARAAEQKRFAATAPALGLGPRWTSTPRMDDAEAQFRHAQLVAPPSRLAAAWLAVPGYFPDSYDWSSAAYLQLGRFLYRERDPERIETLAQELRGWRSKQSRDEQLADLLEISGMLLRGDVDGLINSLNRTVDVKDRVLSDPGLIDFGVEVVADALWTLDRPGQTGAEAQRPKLLLLRHRLLLLRNRVLATDLAVR
ncbi:protein kinase domain-containing protein [Paludisphaera rhizosphaerae]|uniref:protein kinase domain-containing protein n=1 Tax=Paludisphaera rhizosphaerae TaxID=2711216 RepID=UPI0013EC9978|nr:protein kinase [Paludisphaera rhizosphaerae]